MKSSKMFFRLALTVVVSLCALSYGQSMKVHVNGSATPTSYSLSTIDSITFDLTSATVLFSKGNTDGSSTNIYKMNPDGTNEQLLYNSGGKWASDARYSPDMSKIVFSTSNSSNGKQQIFIMNADGSSPMQLTTNADDNCWSPQIVGTKIWYVATVSFQDQRIFTMNMDGSGQIQVSTQSGQHNYFKVVGDTVYYILSSSGNSNASNIYKAPLNFATTTAITTQQYCMFYDASPDAKTCIRQRKDASDAAYGLYLVKTDGSGETQLTPFTSGGCSYARYSLDGTKVIYQYSNSTQVDIYMINLDGTNNTQITNTTSLNEWPTDWR